MGAAGATIVLLGTPLPAGANHQEQPFADNADHSFHANHLGPNTGQVAFDWGVDRLARGINVWTGSGDVDVEVYDDTYGDTGWHGLTLCTDFVDAKRHRCDDFTVKFNQSQPKSRGLWKSLGAHEFGHTVGLGHRWHINDGDDNSCMRVEIWPADYDAHDLASFAW